MNDNNVIMFFMKIKSDQESNSTGFILEIMEIFMPPMAKENLD